MKGIILFLAAVAAISAGEVQVFTGRITDTMCGVRHLMVKDQPDDDCIRLCVKGTSSQYALFDGKTVMRLGDQKMPAKFAGQAVRVTGAYNEKTKTIKVVSIEPAP